MSRYRSVLDRSEKSEKIIRANERFASELGEELDRLKEKLNELNQEFQIKKNNFSKVNQ